MANFSFVPTPSVLLNNIGSLYLSFFKSNNEQKPPGFLIISFLKFFFVMDSSLLTKFDAFVVFTPADLYVKMLTSFNVSVISKN